MTVTPSYTAPASNCNQVVTVTRSSADNCNNIDTAGRPITVNDNIAPVVTPPANLAPMACFDAGAVATWAAAATATDNCGGTMTVTPSYTAPASNCNQVVTVTFSSTDNCGNTGTATATFTVNDNIAPVVTPPANLAPMACFDAGAVATWAAAATATDNCGGTMTVTPSYTAPASNCNQVVTVTFSSTDNCGNTGTATATFTVNDNIAPVVTPPANLAPMAC